MAPVNVHSGKYYCHQRAKQQFPLIAEQYTANERRHCSNYKALVHVARSNDDEIIRAERIGNRAYDAEPRPAAQCQEEYVASYKGGKNTSHMPARSAERMQRKYIAYRFKCICRLRRECVVARHTGKHGIRPIAVLSCLLMIIPCIFSPSH